MAAYGSKAMVVVANKELFNADTRSLYKHIYIDGGYRSREPVTDVTYHTTAMIE